MELIKTTKELEQAADALRSADFAAVDTEFMRESTFWPQLCLIQAAAGNDEFLIDPLSEELDLGPFLEFLTDETVTKVFHACRQDIEIFFFLGGELIPKPLFDTQIAAMAVGLGDSISYDNLVRALLKRDIDKGSRFTDWSRRPLSKKQADYALADVTHLRDLYPMLRDRLADKGREGWVDEEMGTLTDPRTYRSEPEDAWRRLKIRKTTPKWLAALKAAAEWREREAQTRDMPRNRVMKDDGLYEIAQAAPVSPDQLSELRAVPRGFERSRPAERLLDHLRTAMDDPKAYAPKVEKRPPPPGNLGPVVEMLKVLLKMVAEDAGVAPRLIANVADLEKIAESDEADVAALSGWRRDVFGEAALRLKRGELALVLEDGRVTAVERRAT
ncbi:ribonuclease D [Marinicauda salina]|uniref:Ribonuclease D n=1 Tax=Marinicauda salina TaxID=2135793 RepID=A0A2U2BV14_9PROT|nr:ribonuclease D [Marinicauda salina]PWE17842.1 ribonuclease D [Marinicauda salina]